MWLVYACRTPYAAEVAEIVWRAGGEVTLVDNLPDGPRHSSLAPVVTPATITDELRGAPAAIPLLTPGHRSVVEVSAREVGVTWFPHLVDLTAVVGRTSTLGEGTVINALAMVGASCRVGRFVHINRTASVGHDADLGDFVTLGPGCVLSGHVTVSPGAFIGAGAVLGPEITVGSNAIVGAGAVVVHDVGPGEVVAGNPARILRTSETGYGGVAVPAGAGPQPTS
jgi:sugar O-acyltransferase (sialic acid O-acetyltransferase NeuD family)